MARKLDGAHKSTPSYNNRVMHLSPIGAPANASLIEDLDAETVLCGPGGDPNRVVIDDVMAKTWGQMLDALTEIFDIAPHDGGTLPMAVDTPLWQWCQDLAREAEILADQQDGYGRIVALPDDKGIAHLTGDETDGYRIDGLLLECDLCVDPIMRGFGIGSMIVATALVKFEELPTWHHDKPGYSFAGAGAVQSGLSIAKALCEKSNDLEVTP